MEGESKSLEGGRKLLVGSKKLGGKWRESAVRQTGWVERQELAVRERQMLGGGEGGAGGEGRERCTRR